MYLRSSLFALITLALFVSSAFGQSAGSFDEDFNLWPVDLKIGGTIIAVGGSNVPTAAKETFLRYVARRDGAIAIVNLSEPDKDSDKEVSSYFEGLDHDAKIEEYGLDNESGTFSAEAKKSIGQASGIVIVAQGALNKGQRTGFESAIVTLRKAIENGATLLVSGRATRLLGSLQKTQFGGLSVESEASGLIPDSIIKSRYYDSRDRPTLLSQLASSPRSVGIGIESETAVVLRGRKIRVIGEGSATFLLMANEKKPVRVLTVREAAGRRANPYETIVDLTAWRRDAIERTIAPFPADDPPVPFVENGTLLIVGGGGMPRGLMDKMVELAGGEDARLIYVPCAEEDEVTGPQRMVEAWKKMGVASATMLHTKDRIKANSDKEFLAPLNQATGIWFGGGRQWNMADSYYGTEAHRLMKDVLKRGGVIGGSSAGASIQGRYMCRANPVANFDIMAPGYERGLGFIGGVAIDQHFSQRRRQRDMTELANRYPQLLGIGLDEATAIIVQKSKADVVGRGKVFFYDRINNPVVPGENDFIALGAGGSFDLAKREVLSVPEESESDADADQPDK